MAKLAVAFKTDTGSIHGKNENSFLYESNLFIVAEGVGGEYLDDIAKEMACRVICKAFFSHLGETHSPGDALLYAMKEANREILEEAKKIGQRLATCVSVVYVRDTIAYFTHLGDSRIYCLQKGEIVRLTRDHLAVTENSGGSGNARDKRNGQALIEALGLRKSPPIVIKKFALHEKDLILMTTAGLTGRLSDMQIQKASLKSSNVKKLCSQLLYEARRVDRNLGMTLGLIRLERKIPVRRKRILAYSGLILFGLSLIAFHSRNDYGEDKMEEPVTVNPVEAERPLENRGGKTSSVEEKNIPSSTEKSMPALEVADESECQAQEKEILTFVSDWKSAWERSAGSGGDMENYMAFYSEYFCSGGFSKATWARDKKKKNRKKGWIRLELKDLRIKGASAGPRVDVRFNQVYSSSNFSIRSRKKLVLQNEDGGWKILTEKTY